MTTIDPERTVERLGTLVDAETPSADRARLLRAYDLMSGWGREALGRDGQVVEVDGVPHLWWEATAQPQVLLLAHADTVWPAGTTRVRPFNLTGGRATGPGVFDMKAGIVIAMDAIGLIEDPDHVAVLITGDEEIGSPSSRALVEAAARGSVAVLVLEPSLDGAMKTSRKGGSIYQIGLHGRGAHAGLEPEAGRNALVELSHIVMACAGLENPSLGTTVTPTRATAGSTNNVVPERAVLTIDVRARTLDELERVDAGLRALDAVDPDVTIDVAGGLNRPPLEPDASTWLLELAREVAQRDGLPEPRGAAVGGASDGNFTAALGIPTLDGLGAIGAGAHAEHEWVDVASLSQRAQLVAGLVNRLTSPDRSLATGVGHASWTTTDGRQ